ncbi:hypothetical protein H6P81_005665 [Aristolochia fimbriata]|uniref:PTC1-like winged helix-turn-helix domain-containing protein n=1 Tax=Aristolochia fimbriata TaxID=158543 RepID=A0AAV7EYU6_ARIFI|nr:hypothetical protein H6P81_005665 [Aristolochia fimbriata]
MPAATLSAHPSSRECDEVPSGHKRKLLLHPLLDEQFIMGTNLGERSLCQQVSSLEFVQLDNLWVDPPEPPLIEPEALPTESARDTRRLGLLCAGLQHWGARKKVHYLGRQSEKLSNMVIREVQPAFSSTNVKAEPLDKEEVHFEKPNVILLEPVGEKHLRKRERKSTFKERKRKKSKVDSENTRNAANILKLRWSKQRYHAAELKLLDVVRAKGAVPGKPILRPDLRLEARKYISDTGLLDHLLKHMAGKVDVERGERLRRRHNADGMMEYWLENADLVELRRQAGVKDPYWVPPPGWKLGDNPYHDSETSSELKQLKDGMCSMKRCLEQLLSEELVSERRDNALVINKRSKEICWTNQSCISSKNNCSKERYSWAKQKLFDVIREKCAILGKPISKSALTLAAREHIADSGLVNYLLKVMVGEVNEERGDRLCQCRNSDGFIEYWLENVNMDDFLSLPKSAESQDSMIARKLRQLVEGLGSMKKYLDQLLSMNHDNEDGDNALSSIEGSQTDPESVNSLEMGCSKRRGNTARWSKERYEWAEHKLLEIMKEKEAFLGRPILRPDLRSEARKHIGDTGLLDHLLKHMAGKVEKDIGMRFCRRHNADGAMEYWLEDADLIERRRQAGVKDPHWVPPPGWKPGDCPYLDSEIARMVKELKEELIYMSRYLEQILSGKNGVEGGMDNLNLGVISLTNPGSSEFFEMCMKSSSLSKNSWLKERYNWAEEKLLSIVRNEGTVSGKPIPGPILKFKAYKCILDVFLVDYLLKHSAGRVYPQTGERLCQQCNSDGVLEFWLERADQVEFQGHPGIEEQMSASGWSSTEYSYCDEGAFFKLEQLMEESDNMKRYLDYLLETMQASEAGDNNLQFTKCSQSDPESTTSLEAIPTGVLQNVDGTCKNPKYRIHTNYAQSENSF